MAAEADVPGRALREGTRRALASLAHNRLPICGPLTALSPEEMRAVEASFKAVTGLL